MECDRVASIVYRKENPESVLQQQLYKFGMTVEDYSLMLASQDGRCAICKRLPEEAAGQKRRLAVDHCHWDNANRGLLCQPCNVSLGLLQESPRVIRAALEYIEKHMAEMGFTEKCE